MSCRPPMQTFACHADICLGGSFSALSVLRAELWMWILFQTLLFLLCLFIVWSDFNSILSNNCWWSSLFPDDFDLQKDNNVHWSCTFTDQTGNPLKVMEETGSDSKECIVKHSLGFHLGVSQIIIVKFMTLLGRYLVGVGIKHTLTQKPSGLGFNSQL